MNTGKFRLKRLVGVDETGFTRNNVCWWLLRRLLLPWVFAMVVMIGMLVLEPLLPPPQVIVTGGTTVTIVTSWWERVFDLLFYAVVLGFGAYAAGVIIVMRRAVRRASGYACPGCLYDLSAVEVERCAECAQRVVHSGLPTMWSAGIAFRVGKKGDERGTGFDQDGASRFEARMKKIFNYGLIGIQILTLAAFGLFVVFGSQILGNVSAALMWSAPLLVVVNFCSFILFFVYYYRSRSKLKAALVGSGGCVCPACLYDLGSTGPVGRCPECGQAVEYGDLPLRWSVRMKMLRVKAEIPESGQGGALP